MYKIQFKKLYPEAKGFVKATEGAAGWDIYAHTIDINPATRSATIYTGIATAFSPDLVMCLFARSGLATKYGLVLANGTGIVDSDYRGEIMLKFRDLSQGAINQLLCLRGERVAQAIFLPVAPVRLVLAQELPATVRGSGGFGSTS